MEKKPVSQINRPDLTRLVELSPGRLMIRKLVRATAKVITAVFTKATITGLDNFPRKGPGLIVVNHLGDADVALGLAGIPVLADAMATIDLFDYPVLGKILHAYGVIWVHRGKPDRKALRMALNALKDGRFLALAPEGRQSLTGSLEPGTGGAAYIATHADVPVIPVTFTGTQDSNVYGNVRRWKRGVVTMTIGPPFYLEKGQDRRKAIDAGTELIMRSLARQLPAEYRGVYAS